MGGKGNSGQQQTTVDNTPWGPQQGYLTDLWRSANNLPLQQPYPFPGFAPFSPTSVAAQEATTQRALQGSPLLPAAQQETLGTTQGAYLGVEPGVGYLQPTIGGAGLDVSQYPGTSTFGRVSQQGLPLGGPALSPLTGTAYGQYLGTTPGTEQLSSVAQGDYLTGGPGFDAAFEAAQRRISPIVRGGFERAGRFGGGLSQEAETRALGDAFAGLYGQERGRQDAAARALDAAYGAERGLMASAAGGLGNLYQGNVGQQLQAAGQLSGLYGGERGFQEAAARQAAQQAAGTYGAERGRQMQAAAMSPAMAQQDYADIGRLAGVGAAQEAKAGEALSDAMQRFYFQQQAPYTRLAAQTPAIMGGFPGGTQTSNYPQPQTSPFASALGGGALGYWAGGPAGLTGLGLSPWGGAAIGAGLGLLGGK